MPKPLHQRLREKGWTEEEINKTLDILYSEEKQIKHEHFFKGVHPILYWVGLVIAVIANFILAVALIPFLMMLTSFQVYIILAVVGSVFGLVFKVIIKDIEHIDVKHHILAGAFIPAVALVTVYLITSVANKFNSVIQNSNSHNPLIASMIYFLTFAAPYTIYKIKDLVEEHKSSVDTLDV